MDPVIDVLCPTLDLPLAPSGRKIQSVQRALGRVLASVKLCSSVDKVMIRPWPAKTISCNFCISLALCHSV